MPQTSATSASLLARLRAATHLQHAALDQSILPHQSAPTRAEYVALLLGSDAVLRSLEGRLATWFDGFSEPSRCALLARDLADLGVRDLRLEVAVAEPRTLVEAYGCAYVVEGSALGGRVVAQRLSRADEEVFPLRYLSLRGADTAAHFQRFCRELEQWGSVATESQRAAACASARATFAAYAAGMDAARKAAGS